MNNQITKIKTAAAAQLNFRMLILLVCFAFSASSSFAQHSAAINRINISSQASAIYSDGTNAYSTISNNENLLLIYSRRSFFRAKDKINICKLNNPARFSATDYSFALQNQKDE